MSRRTPPIVIATLLAAASLLGCPSEPPRDASGRLVTIGKYRIRTFPKGAQVWVDGQMKVPRTPATLVLEAGEYHLRIKHPGATEALEETITIEAAEEKTLDVRIPPPARSTLSVVSDVEGASVRVNGYRRGVTPLDPVTVTAGPVDVTVTTADGRARSASTRLDWGEDEVLRVDFADATDAGTTTPLASGRLTLIVAPEGWVEGSEGQRLGDTPIRDLELSPGLHRFRLHTADGRRARDVALRVGPGERSVYRFRLGPDDAIPDGGLPALASSSASTAESKPAPDASAPR